MSLHQSPSTGERTQRVDEEMPSAASVVPEALTPLVGREADIAAVLALMDSNDVRIITLTGPGGVGKTRLAIAVAHAARRDVVDEVVIVQLAAIAEPAMVKHVLAQRAGIVLVQGTPVVEQLARALGMRRLLIVVDNYEHLLSEPPVWLVQLLSLCPRLTVMVTSRTALNLSGEHRYVVAPLPVDPAGSEIPAAVKLFDQRARAVRPGFELDAAGRDVVAAICRRLDGLPLAIELAAARVTVLTAVEILERIGDRFAILRGGQRDAPARQQTMGDAVAWSYDLLPADHQEMFRQLAVLNASFSLAAAVQVSGVDEGEALVVLEALVDCSLLTVEDGGTGTRFLMLETIREFGLGRLRASGEETEARNRMADWCLALARQLSPNGLTPDEWLLIDRGEEEMGHLRATLSWLEQAGRMAEVAELVLRLRWLWFFQGREREGVQWLDRVLAWSNEGQGGPHIDALIYAGQLAITIDDPRAEAYLTEAAALARESADRFRAAEAKFYLAGLTRSVGRYAEARALFEELLEFYRAGPVPWRVAVVTYHLGVLAYAEGELDRAEQLLAEATAAGEPLGNRIVATMSSAFLALIACEQRNAERAVMQIQRRADDVSRVGRADYEMIADAAGVVAVACGDYELAARLFGAASQPGTDRILPERLAFERAEAIARKRLGEEAFARAWAEGRRVPQAEIAAELARLSAPERDAVASAQAAVEVQGGLTPRELEVLRYLADGLTNQQIADALFISRKTATNHVASILGKLGVESRTAAASFAIRHHLD